MERHPEISADDRVRVEKDAAALRRMVEENGELEWDSDLFSPALGREGVVVRVDEDGTAAIRLLGEEDEVYLPLLALTPLDLPPEVARLADSLCEQPKRSPLVPALRESFRSAASSHHSIREAAETIATSITTEAKGMTQLLAFALFTVSFNGFLVGYALQIFDASRDLINFGPEGRGQFLSDMEKTAMSNVCWVVAALTAFAGDLIGKLGRKGPTVVAVSLFITGEVMCAGSRNMGTMLFGKVFTGISLGMLTTTTPAFLAELAPSCRRSTFVMLWVTMLALGELAASLLTLHFGEVQAGGGEGWRWMLGLVVAPACLHFLLILRLPESPAALVRNGRVEEASQLLSSLHPGSQSVLNEMEESVIQTTLPTSRTIFGKHRRTVVASIILMAYHQALNERVYSASCQPADASHSLLLRQVGMNSTITAENQLVASLDTMVLLVTLLMTVVAALCSRRRLLLVSTGGLCVSLAVTGLGVRGETDVVSFIGLLCVQFFYTVGIACVPWFYASEVGGTAVAAYWVSLIAMDIIRCPLGALGDTGVRYLVAAAVALLALSWVFFRIPHARATPALDDAARLRKRREDSQQSLMNTADDSPRELDEIVVRDLAAPPAEPVFTGLSNTSVTSTSSRPKKGGFRKKQSTSPGNPVGGGLFDGLQINDSYASYPEGGQ